MRLRFPSRLRDSGSGRSDDRGSQRPAEPAPGFVLSQKGQVLHDFSEVESGGLNDRPQLNAALDECKRSKATLVVAKLDRLSRNAEFLLRLQNSGVNFVCCDCPNVDRFTVGILALVAQRERELISERTKAALTAAKARGVRLGGCRDGHQRSTLMVRANRQAAQRFNQSVIGVIREIQATGATTLQSIAHCLTRRGISTRTGRTTWHPTQVRNILRST
jgi:DNA invertase Pin-like site-specific DNA recombinase